MAMTSSDTSPCSRTPNGAPTSPPIRIVVHPAHRRQGIATTLARHAVVAAAREGIKKLIVEVLSHESATIAMFTGLGFEAEALFRDQVHGPSGEVATTSSCCRTSSTICTRR